MRAEIALHSVIPPRLAPGERGSSRPHGGAVGSQAPDAGPPANSVEHPFGTIKQWMGQGTFLMRQLENVRSEFSLTALAYNLRRAITLVGVPGLIAAVRA